jgi:hypothetical protein
MVRQKDNVAVYKITGEKTGRNYYVELLHLQNNYYGNPRFEAHIISIEHIEKYDYCGAWVYRFTGHYFSEQEECNWIVGYHEKKKELAHKN